MRVVADRDVRAYPRRQVDPGLDDAVVAKGDPQLRVRVLQAPPPAVHGFMVRVRERADPPWP
jgi:hypothetical protein